MEMELIDRPTTAAALNEDAIASIVADIKAHLVLWAGEAGTSFSAIEAKLRRERAMGMLLATLKKAGLLDRGGRPAKIKTDNTLSSVSLADLRIRPEQSSRWQVEARVPEEEFITWIEKMKACDGEISSAALRRLAMGLGLCKKPDTASGDDDEFQDVDASITCPNCGEVIDFAGAAS